MNVLFAASEVTPFAKAGGIADVVGALPIALQKLGCDVRLIIPRYESLTGSPRLEGVLRDVPVMVDGGEEYCEVFRTTLPDSTIPVYFIENRKYLSRGPIYNEHGQERPFAEMSRFLFFSAAVTAVIPKLGWMPQIVHCHDWHTGMIPTLLGRTGLNDTKTVMTIHNIAHQGVWNPHDIMGFLGIPETEERYHLDARDARGNFNVLQQGIMNATIVNTVSPTYAKEILTPEFGEGLQNTLNAQQGKLAGILNGINTTRLDPATDQNITARYDRNSLDKKAENKRALQQQCGLKQDPAIPILGFVGRLAGQKGIDLILENCTLMAKAGIQLVLLGTGLPDIEKRVTAATERHPGNVFANLGFDNAFAQRIYAGSDLVLVPSSFEPCGLVQIIAMRYGTPAIVRATGGLKDTVPDADSDPVHGLGFSFDEFTGEALWEAIVRSMRWYKNPTQWRMLITHCMDQDFSWDSSAKKYHALYERITK